MRALFFVLCALFLSPQLLAAELPARPADVRAEQCETIAIYVGVIWPARFYEANPQRVEEILVKQNADNPELIPAVRYATQLLFAVPGPDSQGIGQAYEQCRREPV